MTEPVRTPDSRDLCSPLTGGAVLHREKAASYSPPDRSTAREEDQEGDQDEDQEEDQEGDQDSSRPASLFSCPPVSPPEEAVCLSGASTAGQPLPDQKTRQVIKEGQKENEHVTHVLK